MNIVNRSHDRLELEHRAQEWMIGLGLVCAVLLIGLLKALFEAEFGGAAIAAAMLTAVGWICLTRVFVRVSVTADRAAGTLTITTSKLTGQTVDELPLADLAGAEAETRYEESNSTAEQGLVLVFGDSAPPRRLRLALFRPDPADLLQAAETISSWIARGATTQVNPGDRPS